MLLQKPCSLESIQEAQNRIKPYVYRTPLMLFRSGQGEAEIYLKLESLQPTGSFKVRGAVNALLQLDTSTLRDGVWTASAGNMAQALAWFASRLNIPCTVIAPDDAPQVKIDAIRSLGAEIIQVPFIQYQQIQTTHRYESMRGRLVHPFGDAQVMAGNGTIGIEILEDLPDVDAVLIPYGGGGLSCGIACALRALKPDVRIFACEVETAAPLAASLAAGIPVTVKYAPSFISGIGAPFVFPEMWPLASQLLDASLVVSVGETANTIRKLAQSSHIIAEGAGAVALTAALGGQVKADKVVCVVSGGNIDTDKLCNILQDRFSG